MSPAKKTTASSSKTIEVGDEVDAKCTKCKGVTKHIVLAKIGWKPTRVECITCKGQHQFRAPGSTTRKAAPKAAPEVSPEEQWKALMKNVTGDPRPYEMAGEYTVGVHLKHKKFGEGVVIGLNSATVCEVAFEEGVKKLIMGARRSPTG